MQIAAVKRGLLALGIDPDDYQVLKLLPLVFVAWADGTMEPIERERLMSLARNHFRVSESGVTVLEDWIQWPPSLSYVRRGMRHLLALALAPEELELELEDLRDLLGQAEAIARTTSVAPDSPFAVGPEEERALAEIAHTLHVDNGMSWASLLRELDSPPGQRSWPN
jgi:tellurite resistance protein